MAEQRLQFKKAKRLLITNTGPTDSLDNDEFLRAMLQLRNTPDPDCNISPAQMIFGRPIRDEFSFVNRLEKYSNPNHSRPLRPLKSGEHVFIQNQNGPNSNKWAIRWWSSIMISTWLKWMVQADSQEETDVFCAPISQLGCL